MARVNYVTCPSCGKDYYIERMLSKAMAANPRLQLCCPFCKQEFTPARESGESDSGTQQRS